MVGCRGGELRYGGRGGRCREVCWEVRKNVWGLEKSGEGCGRVYGVSGEACWHVGKGCEERCREVC